MKARLSYGKEYDCMFDWGCFCQAGEHGVVFSQKGNYTTAFFEAFPKKPKCFLRGEGSTVEEAEKDCWEKYQKVLTCNHEMERRGRTDGYAYCKHCSYSAMVFEPLTRCCRCGVPTSYYKDTRGRFYCRKCDRVHPRKYEPSYMEYFRKRLPRKCKKMVKQGASALLYEGNRYGKVKYSIGCLFDISGNGRGFSSVWHEHLVNKCINAYKNKKDHENKRRT